MRGGGEAALVEWRARVGGQVQGVTDIGRHYAVTLRAWRAAWEARRGEVLQLGYSPRFWRKYRRAPAAPLPSPSPPPLCPACEEGVCRLIVL